MQELEGINLGTVPFVGITTLHYYWQLHKFLILDNFLFAMNISGKKTMLNPCINTDSYCLMLWFQSHRNDLMVNMVQSGGITDRSYVDTGGTVKQK